MADTAPLSDVSGKANRLAADIASPKGTPSKSRRAAGSVTPSKGTKGADQMLMSPPKSAGKRKVAANDDTPSKAAKGGNIRELFTSPRKSLREPEPLLDENPDRFCMFPIKHPKIWEMYKKAEASFWTGK